MKSKKLLFSTLLMLGGIATYTFLGSNSGGKMGVSTSGCSCHGVANAATSIAVEGMPATGFVPGTSYPLVLKITNSTKAKAGFDMSVTAGAMSGAPAGTMLMGGTELHHTTPANAVSGISSWPFTWTAPATGSTAIFNIAGLAANNDGDDSGDTPNKIAITFNKANPASISDFKSSSFNLYPNPANEFITFSSANNLDMVSFKVLALNGTMMPITASKLNETSYSISTRVLPVGNYILVASQNGKQSAQVFSKK
jgi:hypothetical protein